MFELFSFDSKKDEVVIDNAIMLEVPGLNKLWSRKRVSKGDTDGRNKVLNRKEMMYVFFMASPSKKNPYRAISEEQREKAARKDCNFETGWSPDQLVQQCVTAYYDYIINYTPVARFLVELEQTINQAATHVTNIRLQNEALQTAITKTASTGLTPADAVSFQGSMQVVQVNLNMLFAVISSVEQATKRKTALEKMLREEEEYADRITGGKTLGNREN